MEHKMIIDYSNLQKMLDNLIIKEKPVTFLSILNKSYNEVLVTKYLSYFLNENNTTRNIIKAILNKTAQNDTIDFVELLENSIFENIKSEDSISNESRLDIIIKYSNFWIVIENKIFASESKENQTLDYEIQLKKTNSNNLPVKFIYLKPYFNKSKPSNNNFAELYYDDLIEIFKKVKEQDLQKPENYLFLQDFIKHSEEFFMKNSQSVIDEEALKFYFDNKEKIEYIINAQKKQSYNIRDLLVSSLSEAFPTFRVHFAPSYIQIYKDSWPNKSKTGIHFEIQPSRDIKFDSLLTDKVVKLRFTCFVNRSISIYNAKENIVFI
jgi:hypothetical protein